MNGMAPLDAKVTLREHGLRPRRRLGQNFLQDPAVLHSIVEAAAIQPSDVVLEIGAGLGNLTQYLAQTARKVIAIELDPQLAAIAKSALAAFLNVDVIQADFLDVTPRELDLPPGYVVAANIPYYVTSPILRHLLESESGPRRIVLTVQQEVAARICAKPPEMSLLSVSVQVYGSPQVVARIPADAFYPVPKVDSAVVRIDCYDRPLVSAALLSVFFKVVKAGFSRPRKMLRNALAAGLGLSASETRVALAGAGIDSARRAETLTIQDWCQLTDVIASRRD